MAVLQRSCATTPYCYYKDELSVSNESLFKVCRVVVIKKGETNN